MGGEGEPEEMSYLRGKALYSPRSKVIQLQLSIFTQESDLHFLICSFVYIWHRSLYVQHTEHLPQLSSLFQNMEWLVFPSES